ncbi:TetR/AcrR family transcriptional regulator [Actinomadura sp. WMMB 499]|uniref:TetR/AcrR family transcriptional regulator n=1 Tax=Actinomadura sp. WMMB 499 TaxID=1219491 RepID=UPI0012488D0C|nr:TetR/AcrR family transcriptional regulator [Actinomadura sp. WMMB 499]QFG24006.1 TetR/AcrR family transcriptional regulator [Actinomadura sp. WMMB 499]
MDRQEAETRLLDAAEALFYRRGVQAVGMDDLRAASGVSLKRLYGTFPSKEALVTAYLERRDLRWTADLEGHVAARRDDPVAAVFDWLGKWFASDGFHGCAFINAYGELGDGSAPVAAAARAHKERLHRLMRGLVGDDALAAQLVMLVDGAIVSASMNGDPGAAATAGAAAGVLVRDREGAVRRR